MCTEGLLAFQLLFWFFFLFFLCKVLITEFANDYITTETQSHYTTSGCALWLICSPDSQYLGKKIHRVVTIKRIGVE